MSIDEEGGPPLQLTLNLFVRFPFLLDLYAASIIRREFLSFSNSNVDGFKVNDLSVIEVMIAFISRICGSLEGTLDAGVIWLVRSR